jgi:glycolate oxidase FAD binding subunit
VLAPSTPAELAEALRDAASAGRSIALTGNATKKRMAGPVCPADVAITTLSLRGVLQYEPRDLTISVGAGLSWRELTCILAENRQMIPLDPPFAHEATVGGVIASNSSGPRRRLYGTARDVVIGMQFATLEGKLVQSGGMVVKNVAGLDMAKMMIGAFGTLAAVAVVNFKLAPMPEVERSFLLAFPSAEEAGAARARILKSQLQPAAIDLLNPEAAATLGNRSWLLVIRVGGNPAAVERYEREFTGVGDSVAIDKPERHATLWEHIQNFTASFLYDHEDGAVVRASCTLKDLDSVIASFPGPALARAGNGVCYGYFARSTDVGEWMASAASRGWKAVIEFAPEARKRDLDLWPAPGGELEIMKRVKQLFDPGGLLNRGRLYGRI